MKIFVWNYVQECSDNYHREGGVVVFAENEDRARELANTRNGCNIQANEKPDDIRDGIWEMGIDVRTDNDALDHIEFVMERTGLGGNISKLKVVDNK